MRRLTGLRLSPARLSLWLAALAFVGLFAGCATYDRLASYVAPGTPWVMPVTTNASPFEVVPSDPVVTNAPVPIVENVTTNTSDVLGCGLPGQRLTLAVRCWTEAPTALKYQIEGERVQDDGTRAWFDVACEWDHVDANGTCEWIVKSREGLLFDAHYVGWRARLVGTDMGGNAVAWEFVIQGG